MTGYFSGSSGTAGTSRATELSYPTPSAKRRTHKTKGDSDGGGEAGEVKGAAPQATKASTFPCATTHSPVGGQDIFPF